MSEVSVSSKLFQFLVALYPSEEKAMLFVPNLKLVLESLRERCLLQSVSISLSLLFLCIDWSRMTQPWCLYVRKIFNCHMCHRPQSRIYILQVVYYLQCSFAQGKKF